MASVVVASELHATVWRIEVAVGEAVETGRELVILECMKTEIPVAAPQPGTVAKILVAEGDLVDERQPLIVLTA